MSQAENWRSTLSWKSKLPQIGEYWKRKDGDGTRIFKILCVGDCERFKHLCVGYPNDVESVVYRGKIAPNKTVTRRLKIEDFLSRFEKA